MFLQHALGRQVGAHVREEKHRTVALSLDGQRIVTRHDDKLSQQRSDGFNDVRHLHFLTLARRVQTVLLLRVPNDALHRNRKMDVRITCGTNLT